MLIIKFEFFIDSCCNYIGTYHNMDINNGNLILERHLMFILNCGNFNNSTGLSFIVDSIVKFMTILISMMYFRQILDAKYGLRRWQIGEIASKIGQLYYHY